MGTVNDDATFPCADARRVLLRTMREVQKVSEGIGKLVSPWEVIGVMGHEETSGGS